MTGTGVSRKEACLLRESLASPKSIMNCFLFHFNNIKSI